MDSARFQLVRGVRRGGRLAPPWPVVAPDPPERSAGGDEVWFGWRLLSRNHRDLARSPLVFPKAEDALVSVERLRLHAEAATTTLAKDPRTGRWTWRLDVAHDVARVDPARDGVTAIAVASRGYLRRRECHECVAQVVALAPVAGDADPRLPVATRTRRGGQAVGPG